MYELFGNTLTFHIKTVNLQSEPELPDLAIKRKSCDFQMPLAAKIMLLRFAIFLRNTCDF